MLLFFWNGIKNQLKEEVMDWLQLTANNTQILDDYKFQSIPRILLLDKIGMIIANDLRGDKIEIELERVFNKE